MALNSGDGSVIDALREELGDIDGKLMELVAKRQAISTELGRLKAAAGQPTRDYGQEKEVIDRARRLARDCNVTGDIAERLMLLLIDASLTAQEHDRVQEGGEGVGRKVLVIGGAGKMGRWFVRFLASQGFVLEIADPSGGFGDFPCINDWRKSALDHDLIVLATPLSVSSLILEELATVKPPGIVFDVGSLKSPLRSGLKTLAEAGVAVTSIHPMFGPDTELLSDRHVIFVDVGVPEATRQVRELFASTMVVQVEMDLESHDRLIAYILGLSHALNIAFFTALAESGEAAPRLAKLSSTTFDAQLEVARRVAGDNPHLYYEIQSLNDYGTEALSALLYAVERVRSVVRAGDEEAFSGMMQRGREYLS